MQYGFKELDSSFGNKNTVVITTANRNLKMNDPHIVQYFNCG